MLMAPLLRPADAGPSSTAQRLMHLMFADDSQAFDVFSSSESFFFFSGKYEIFLHHLQQNLGLSVAGT